MITKMLKILKNFKKFLYLSFLEIRSLYQINCLPKDRIFFFSESGFYKDFFEEEFFLDGDDRPAQDGLRV